MQSVEELNRPLSDGEEAEPLRVEHIHTRGVARRGRPERAGGNDMPPNANLAGGMSLRMTQLGSLRPPYAASP